MSSTGETEPPARSTRVRAWIRRNRNPSRWPLGVFTLAAAGVVAVVGGLLFWLFWHHLAPGSTDRPATAFDLARSTVTLLGVLTIGGAAAVAYRRQIHLEGQAVREDEKNRLAANNDAREESKERRAERSDLHARYQQAAAMLANTEPMIRVAGIYALEALAVEWATIEPTFIQRDVCIDLLCGYLRSATGITPATAATPAVIDPAEKNVRDTITTVIARHLHDPDDPAQPGDWSNRDYNFTGAHIHTASFHGAHFNASPAFDRATFHNHAWFNEATFNANATFGQATFHASAWFDRATFNAPAWFGEATFNHHASFMGTTFNAFAWFNEATFNADAWFNDATFNADATFGQATFHADAWFQGATFRDGVVFARATFYADARFARATIILNVEFNGAHILGRLILPVIADNSLKAADTHFDSTLPFYWARIESLGARPMNPHTCDQCATLLSERGC